MTAASLWSLSGVSQAADPPKAEKLVATNITQVDELYQYQGEYMGFLPTRPGFPAVTKQGLQVISKGNGQFEAVLFQGGLPGDGWDQSERLRYPATVDQGEVHVEAGPYLITIADNLAVFRNAKGAELGRLPKYARYSSSLGKPAPEDAIVLFNGQKNDLWKNMKVTEDGLLEEGCETVDLFEDFHLHIEFRLPYKPEGKGQDRGNSGVYLQRRYEVQVLDSFGNDGKPNECGGIYTLHSPDQNMCLPPLSWQTYDIDFKAARFDDEGNKIENMKIRVKQNGIVIHDALEVTSKTGAGRPEGPEPMPILLQDHKNPVRYRNIWIVKGNPFAAEEANAAQAQELLAEGEEQAPAPNALTDEQQAPFVENYTMAAPVRRGFRGHRGYYYYGQPYHGGPYDYPLDYRTPYHNYGYDPFVPTPYWYSPGYVDLPPFPYYGF